MMTYNRNKIILILLIISVSVYVSQSARRTVSTRDWPQNDEREYEVLTPKAVWTCNFELHDCGIINDPNVGTYFKRQNGGSKPLLGKKNIILLNITEINSHPSGARLITPYFQTKHYLKGCLTINYLQQGNGMNDLFVIQQDGDNKCIWNLINDRNKETQKWQKLSLTIELKNSDPRFFIESHFDNRPPNTGLIAISDINFYYNPCDKSDANYCDSQISSESTDYPNDLP